MSSLSTGFLQEENKKKWIESLSLFLQDDWWPALRIGKDKIAHGPKIQSSKSTQMQSGTLWTHQFASGSSIAACTWHHAQANIPCPLCVNVTFLLPGLIWQFIHNHPSGSGVNTGGENLSAAGTVDRLSKNLFGTRMETWDAKSPPEAQQGFLSRR